MLRILLKLLGTKQAYKLLFWLTRQVCNSIDVVKLTNITIDTTGAVLKNNNMRICIQNGKEEVKIV